MVSFMKLKLSLRVTVPCAYCIAGWMGPRVGLDEINRVKSLASAGNRTPKPQSSSPYPSRYMIKYNAIFLTFSLFVCHLYQTGKSVRYISAPRQLQLFVENASRGATCGECYGCRSMACSACV
jgi:hypothetical protein